MPNRKHSNSPVEKSEQKLRTHRNKIKKYQHLLAKPHTAKEDKIFKAKLEHSLSKI